MAALNLSVINRAFIGLLAFGAIFTAAPIASAAASTTNLVQNPGCETSTAGWVSYQGALKRATSVAHSGSASCQVTYTSGGFYTLDDSPATVANPAKGAQYSATAWVRA